MVVVFVLVAEVVVFVLVAEVVVFVLVADSGCCCCFRSGC